MKEAIKLVIEDTFSPAIDFRAPYAKLMLDRASEKIVEIVGNNEERPGGGMSDRAFQEALNPVVKHGEGC
jgi:hypothetical protein